VRITVVACILVEGHCFFDDVNQSFNIEFEVLILFQQCCNVYDLFCIGAVDLSHPVKVGNEIASASVEQRPNLWVGIPEKGNPIAEFAQLCQQSPSNLEKLGSSTLANHILHEKRHFVRGRRR
jgi:hypothetical protein